MTTITEIKSRQSLPGQRKHLDGNTPAIPGSPQQWLEEKAVRDQEMLACPVNLWQVDLPFTLRNCAMAEVAFLAGQRSAV